MGLFDYLQQMAQKAGQNIDSADADTKEAMKNALARAAQMNNGDGSVMDYATQSTPAEDRVVQRNSQAAMGSLAPEGAAFDGMTGRLAEDTPQVAAARDVANSTADTGQDINAVSQTQQQLARAQDFADRARAQKFARIKSILNR